MVKSLGSDDIVRVSDSWEFTSELESNKLASDDQSLLHEGSMTNE